MELYHFSEDPTIEVFQPRAPLAHPDYEPLVWAIDAWHQPKYFTPRDCPRVCFWPLERTTPADRERLWTYIADRMVVAIEARWSERLRATQLYRYVLPGDQFEDLHDTGHFISRHTIVPLRVEPLGNLIDELARERVELRICRSITPLAHVIAASTLQFSLIRMRNAYDWDGPPGKPAS